MQERLHVQAPILLPATRNLLREAERLVETPIELTPVPTLANDARASLRLPRGNTHHYTIRYSERYQRHLDHLIPHELGHLRRLHEAPPTERLVPISTAATRERAARQLEGELQQLVRSGAPETLVVNLLPVWAEGAVAQLTNFPADIRIEREIRRTQPELIDAQEHSLLEQVRELRRTLSLEVERFTPPTIYRNALYMNYVLIREIATLLDEKEILPLFARRVNRRLADDLYSMATAGEDEGYAGDRRVIAAWAERLEMTDWFEWMSVDRLRGWPEP